MLSLNVNYCDFFLNYFFHFDYEISPNKSNALAFSLLHTVSYSHINIVFRSCLMQTNHVRVKRTCLILTSITTTYRNQRLIDILKRSASQHKTNWDGTAHDSKGMSTRSSVWKERQNAIIGTLIWIDYVAYWLINNQLVLSYSDSCSVSV